MPAFLLVAASGQAQSFEGAVIVRLSADTPKGRKTEQVEFLMRDGNIRANMGGVRGMAVLAGAKEQKLYLLVPSQRSYAELPLTAADLAAVADTSLPDMTMKRTGAMETVAGLACEHVLVSGPGGVTDVCLTRELGQYINPLDAMSGGDIPVWQQAVAREGFPLRVKIADGSVPFEVVRVDRRKVARYLFIVPLDYVRTEPPRRR